MNGTQPTEAARKGARDGASPSISCERPGVPKLPAPSAHTPASLSHSLLCHCSQVRMKAASCPWWLLLPTTNAPSSPDFSFLRLFLSGSVPVKAGAQNKAAGGSSPPQGSRTGPLPTALSPYRQCTRRHLGIFGNHIQFLQCRRSCFQYFCPPGR